MPILDYELSSWHIDNKNYPSWLVQPDNGTHALT